MSLATRKRRKGYLRIQTKFLKPKESLTRYVLSLPFFRSDRPGFPQCILRPTAPFFLKVKQLKSFLGLERCPKTNRDDVQEKYHLWASKSEGPQRRSCLGFRRRFCKGMDSVGWKLPPGHRRFRYLLHCLRRQHIWTRRYFRLSIQRTVF